MRTGTQSPTDIDLSVRIGDLTLNNPVMPASGTYDWEPNDGHPLHPNELGAIVTKSITNEVREGNPPPRIFEGPQTLLNSIGIPSPGFGAYKKKYLERMTGLETRVITSIAGFSPEDFASLCSRLDDEPRVDAIELNLSCPNLETDSVFATDLEAMTRIIVASRRSTSKPLVAKLSPSVHDIRDFVRAAEDAGADGLCIANTFTGLLIDVESMKPRLGNVRGGVSGPGMLPIVLRHVWDAAQVTALPIVASGGIFHPEDALQYLLAGATAVQVGTANYRDPLTMRSIASGLAAYLRGHGERKLTSIVGRAQSSPTFVPLSAQAS